MNLREQVESQEPNFNPELNLLGGVFHSPGYHSRIPSGTWVHSTRTNIYYALALLELGDEAYRDRAAAVIRNILALQVTDPYDPAFGIWPWNCEEPVPMMAPPDWNWADFIGAALCHMLKEHRDPGSETAWPLRSPRRLNGPPGRFSGATSGRVTRISRSWERR